MLEKCLIVNSFLGNLPTATKQAAGSIHADFLVHVSKSKLNKHQRTLKKFKALIGVYNWCDKCTSNSSLSVFSLNDLKNIKKTKLPNLII